LEKNFFRADVFPKHPIGPVMLIILFLVSHFILFFVYSVCKLATCKLFTAR